MTADVVVALFAAMLLCTAIMIVVTATGLNRTSFCLIPSLGVLVLLWMAYPPAQALPPIVSILFWGLITYVMYHFPTASMPPDEATPEDDLLETFFKETPNA